MNWPLFVTVSAAAAVFLWSVKLYRDPRPGNSHVWGIFAAGWTGFAASELYHIGFSTNFFAFAAAAAAGMTAAILCRKARKRRWWNERTDEPWDIRGEIYFRKTHENLYGKSADHRKLAMMNLVELEKRHRELQKLLLA